MAVVRLTDRFISKLKPAADCRDDYADAIIEGLHLRVTAYGRKTFSVVYRFDGRQRRWTLGPYPRWSLAQARTAAIELLQQADAGVDPARPPAEAPPLPTLAEAIAGYTDTYLKPNVRSWRNVVGNLHHAAVLPLHGRALASLTRRDVHAVVDAVVATGTPHAAVNVLRHLRALCNWGLDRDLLAVNPCDRVRPPARPGERDRVLSDAELAAAWRAVAQLPPPYRQMWQLFLLTGQRRTEVRTMTWGDIDGDTWTIPRERVKAGRAHLVPLVPAALAVLASLPRGAGGYVFSRDGGVTPSSNYTKVKEEVDRLSGVTGWVIHDLRRTVRSKLAELGVPLEVARKVTNHEQGRIDRIYNRYAYADEKRAALQRWADRLHEIAAAHPPAA